jgi:hypothetical protein
MTSSDVAGRLVLTDSGGTSLRSDTNSYSANDPMIVQFLPAGTYQLTAQGAQSGAGGIYQITLLANSGPRSPFCGSTGLLAASNSIFGDLTFAGCQYSDGTFANLYQMNVGEASTATLLLQSTAFDAYLVLLDAKGNLVVEDDNSGGGTDAQISQPLAAGTYYVVAKAAATYYAVGAYTLSLQTQ